MNILILAAVAVALVVLLALALMPATKRKAPTAAEPIDEPTEEAIASAAGDGYSADVVWVSHRLRLRLTPASADLISSALQMFEREAAARHVARTLGLSDAV